MVTVLVALDASMAAPDVLPRIVPELTMVLPPAEPLENRIPVLPLIAPALLMVPEKVETLAIAVPAAAAEIVPAFDMPPVKVGPEIWRAVVAEVIVLALSITIP